MLVASGGNPLVAWGAGAVPAWGAGAVLAWGAGAVLAWGSLRQQLSRHASHREKLSSLFRASSDIKYQPPAEEGVEARVVARVRVWARVVGGANALWSTVALCHRSRHLLNTSAFSSRSPLKSSVACVGRFSALWSPPNLHLLSSRSQKHWRIV